MCITRKARKNLIIWTRTVQEDNLGVPTSISFAEKINEGTLYLVQRTIFIIARNYVVIYLTTVWPRILVHLCTKCKDIKVVQYIQEFLSIYVRVQGHQGSTVCPRILVHLCTKCKDIKVVQYIQEFLSIYGKWVY